MKTKAVELRSFLAKVFQSMLIVEAILRRIQLWDSSTQDYCVMIKKSRSERKKAETKKVLKVQVQVQVTSIVVLNF